MLLKSSQSVFLGFFGLANRSMDPWISNLICIRSGKEGSSETCQFRISGDISWNHKVKCRSLAAALLSGGIEPSRGVISFGRRKRFLF